MISIVITYYNRRFQLINTLKSISLSSYKNIEVIVIDDGSDEDQIVNDLEYKFSFLKVFRIKPNEKTWINPCIAFNLGFKKSNGEIIIIQNAENIHAGDIISDVINNQKENEYYVYGCYSISENLTKSIDVDKFENYKYINDLINPIEYVPASFEHANQWYQHSSLNDRKFHFCSSVYKKQLENIGGFDEKFSEGICFDDNEFKDRMCKHLNQKSIDEPFVIHQWHTKSSVHSQDLYSSLYNKNCELYNQISK